MRVRRRPVRPAYTIGDVVLTRFRAEAVVGEDGIRVYEAVEIPETTGWIAGAVRRQEGRYHAARGGGGFESDPDPPYFEQTGSVLLWQIRTSLMGKAIEAFERDVTLSAWTPFERELAGMARTPWRPRTPWPDGAKAEMQRAFADAPQARGSGGRFIKGGAHG